MAQIHARNVADHPALTLTYVCARSHTSAERLATQFEATPATDAHAVLAGGEIDAAVIASPNSTHLDLILTAARSQVAVLCEKPIDSDLDRARASWPEIQRSPAPLMLAFNRRYDPSFAAVRDRVASGDIGRLEQLTIISRDPAPSPKEYVVTSGGIFRDMTIHDFDMARSFVPEIVEVNAFGANVFSDYTRAAGDFDSAIVTMRGAADELITIINSRHSPYGYDQRLEAFGDQGMLAADNPLPTTVRHSSPGGIGRHDASPTYYLDRYSQSYRRQLHAFVTAIETGTPCSPGYVDGLWALELAYAAAESAVTGRVVRVSPPR
jgi:myo-inositol 2-dehydrogenase / D-chiro-inositol 1-dehydrogenase